MSPILEVSIRTLIGFIVLMVIIRLIGKKQRGELSFFNYVTGIALGNIAGDMVVHKDITLTDGIVGMTLWGALTFILGYISLKSPKARVILTGEPEIVIKDGEIIRKVLASHRISIDNLSMLLRNNNVFSIKEVDYAILEPNGLLSVIKKSNLEPVTKKDMNIQQSNRQFIPTEIIVEGNVIEKNLRELGLGSEWLGNQLKLNRVNSIKDIFYAQLQEDGSLYVLKE
jgi:uncharacterized membrane protein YcaP (DUF421 family)